MNFINQNLGYIAMGLFNKVNKKVVLAVIVSVSLTGNVLAVPKLSGNYIVSLTKNCQATVTYNNNVINNIQPGYISASLYQLKITPNSTGVAGTIIFSGYDERGNNLRSNTMGSNNTLQESFSSNKSGTYANTATTFTTGSSPYHVYYGSIDSSNIAHYAALIRLKDDNNAYNNSVPNKCSEQGTLVRQ